MAVPPMVFPVPSIKSSVTLKDSYNRVYVPGTTRKYVRGKHGGIDIAAPRGRVAVAPIGGNIIFPKWGSALGKHLVVFNKTLNYGFLLCHLDTVAVKAGQYVSAGTKIGTVGLTGQTSGAHVHFEAHPGPLAWTRIENPYIRLLEAQKK